MYKKLSLWSCLTSVLNSVRMMQTLDKGILEFNLTCEVRQASVVAVFTSPLVDLSVQGELVGDG